MPKLLIVTDTWTPQVNGVVTSIQNIKKELEQKGVEVTIVHPGLFSLVSPLPIYPEVSVTLFPKHGMREHIRFEKPDYVHISTEGSLGYSARNVCIEDNIPFTTYFHTNWPLYVEHYVFLGKLFVEPAYWYLHWFHAPAKALFVATQTLASEFEKRKNTNVVITPNGVDIDFFVRNEERTPAEAKVLPRPLFVYVGRVAHEKNVEEFLQLNLPGTKVVIGGGPQLEEFSERYAKSATFLGYKKGQELVDWLSASDVCVFPSRTDTFGLVVIEALSCGVPVAAHDVLGPRDIITNGVDGVLSDDLEKAALKCLTLSRVACREKAEQFSWKKAGEIFWRNVTRV